MKRCGRGNKQLTTTTTKTENAKGNERDQKRKGENTYLQQRDDVGKSGKEKHGERNVTVTSRRQELL